MILSCSIVLSVNHFKPRFDFGSENVVEIICTYVYNIIIIIIIIVTSGEHRGGGREGLGPPPDVLYGPNGPIENWGGPKNSKI